MPSPRLISVRAAVATDVTVKGSIGWYERLRGRSIELFGDRGFLLGTPTLKPEQGPSAEFGAVWRTAHAHRRVDRPGRCCCPPTRSTTQPRQHHRVS